MEVEQMPTALDEIVEKVSELSKEERNELLQLLQEEKKKITLNGKKGSVSPNTVWMRENQHKYAGLHVALKDGELIATGKTIKEANVKAKEKGFKNLLLAYIPREDEELWGGW
jgi:molybdopterin converting factor small subunit